MKQILCFGDSNTWGYNPRNGERFPWGIRWSSILQQNLEKENIRIIEEGLCGRTTVFEDPLRENRKGVDLLPAILESQRPDALIIMLGTNDCKTLFGATPELIGKGMERLIAQAKEYISPEHILLMSPIHLGKKVWEPGFDPEFCKESVKVSTKLATVYQRIAKENGLLFFDAASVASSSEADQEHMDEYGHRALSSAITKIINEQWSDSFHRVKMSTVSDERKVG